MIDTRDADAGVMVEGAPAPDGPPLAPPPAGGALHGLDAVARLAFRCLNRWFMVPVQRAGLGAWLGSPVGGWMLLLRARGRRSGLVRETPLSYLVAEGSVWVVAGFGPDTQWYRNILANPAVEVVLPGRDIVATASEVRDPAVRARIIPALVRATGLPSFLGGINPWRDDDATILGAMDFVPLIRLEPRGGRITAGPDDPGGTGWRWRQGALAAIWVAIAGSVALVVRAGRRAQAVS